LPQYRAIIEDVEPTLTDLTDVIVYACGRMIPCSIDRGRVNVVGPVEPPL
jgi:hypothetical protein